LNETIHLVIQQRLKEATLQAQAQQIQAALPTLLAAQAISAYQQPTQPTNIAHPGTKFNNRPLVKFPVPRPTIRPAISTTQSRHRLGSNLSGTNLPTYQQIQEIERGISLDEAINSKGTIDITQTNN